MLSLLSIFEYFSNSAKEINDFNLKIVVILLIARDKHVLNNADSSLRFELHTFL